MKKRMRIRTLLGAMSLALLLTETGYGPANAAEPVLPSLFHNEEPWYKDAVAPLVFREGKYYLPAELLSMFDNITVTVPREDNLLIQNTATGWYLSVLFRDQTAAENGRIVENVGVFRDSGMYYVEAYLTCRAVGLETELYVSEDGQISLRVSDENRQLDWEEVLDSYLPAEEEHEEVPAAPEADPEEAVVTVKRIYVICTTPDSGEPEYSAEKNLEESGVRYTRFLGEDATVESILHSAANGAVGLIPVLKKDGTPDMDALRRLNDRVASLVRIRSHLVIAAGSETADELLRQAGYRVIKPDFRQDGGVEPDQLLLRIRDRLDQEAESCTLLLEDCWNSAAMTELLRTLNSDWYVTAGLSD